MNGISRRRFIQKTLIMGAAITSFPTVLVRRAAATWAQKTVIHPNVNNLRVVGIADTRMTKTHEPASSWARQNELVVTEQVWEHIDRLACALAETRNPKEAWQTIFIKPPQKSWSDAVVAIKTNNIAQQHTRSAVMSKIVSTLTDILAVKPSNVHIYDACHGHKMGKYTPFAGLTGGCRIVDTWGGSTTSTAVAAPWKGTGGKAECLKHLVDGSVDILINIAMCKGHSSRFGGFTMTMKNHFAGKVIYPRQQLCLIDAIWASKGGPGGKPSHQPNFLAMGVMSPIVDYQVATKFRGEKMGWEPNMRMTRRMLTDFGYTEDDLPSGGKIIEV